MTVIAAADDISKNNPITTVSTMSRWTMGACSYAGSAIDIETEVDNKLATVTSAFISPYASVCPSFPIYPRRVSQAPVRTQFH